MPDIIKSMFDILGRNFPFLPGSIRRRVEHSCIRASHNAFSDCGTHRTKRNMVPNQNLFQELAVHVLKTNDSHETEITEENAELP